MSFNTWFDLITKFSSFNNNFQNFSIQNVTSKCEILKDISSWRAKLHNDQLTIIHINLNGIEGKWDMLCAELEPVLKLLDVLILTEVKVKENEALAYQLKGFKSLSKCRICRGGGGIVAFINDKFETEDLEYNFDQAESLIIKIKDNKKKIIYTIISIYRPPDLNVNRFISDLDHWLQNATKKDDFIVMIGDINICILKKTNENLKYFNSLFQNTLLPMIREPTREELLAGNPTISCLDHINVRSQRCYKNTASVIMDKLADHYYIALRVQKENSGNRVRTESVTKTVPDNDKIQLEIEKIDWNNFKKIKDPDRLYSEITAQFNKIYELCTKNIVVKDNYLYTPWVNQRIKNEINKKQRLLRDWQNNKNNLFTYDRYKIQRNVVTNMIKKEKRIYYYKKFLDAKGNMRKTWQLINELMDRKKKEPIEEVLKKNFQTTDLESLANRFNKNFIQQIKNIQTINQGPDMIVPMNTYLPSCNRTSMYLRKVRKRDVERIIKNMKKSGRGIDGIRSGDIIRNVSTFSPLITHFVNLCLDTGKLPDTMKISAIIPLHKKSKVDDLSMYRPVGSMPILEKVIEKHINIQMKKYLTENDILPTFQHGFQAGKSTMTLLLDFANIINTALDQRMAIIIIFLDLSLCFDTLSHTVLTDKFKEIGINHPLLVNNFYNNRKQVTRIGEIKSDTEDVQQGLVQGGINSPTCFNTYTYDVQYVQRKCHLKMFADDSCIISVHRDVKIAVENAQSDFINLQKYFYKNNIYLNDKKTETMVIGFASKKIDMTEHRIYCHSRDCLVNGTYATSCTCYKAEYVKKVKYLGMVIDSELKMRDHVDQLNKKMRIVHYKLKKISADSFPLTTKKTMYFSLVDSILRYGAPIYYYAPQYVQVPLNRIQNKIKMLLFKNCQNVQSMTPTQLSKFILIILNYYKEEYRQIVDHPHSLRVQRFRRERVTTKTYGDRRLEYYIPTLLNNYCQEFLDEKDKRKLKEKLKEKLISR